MNAQISEFLIKLALPAATTLAALLLARLLHKLHEAAHAKASQEAAGSISQRAFEAMAVLSESAATAVTVVENTLRPTIKGAAADGKLTKEEGALLASAAVKLAEEQAKKAAPEVLKAAGFDAGAISDLLVQLVEAAAARLAGDSRANMDPAPKTASVVPVDPSKAPA